MTWLHVDPIFFAIAAMVPLSLTALVRVSLVLIAVVNGAMAVLHSEETRRRDAEVDYRDTLPALRNKLPGIPPLGRKNSSNKDGPP